MLKEMEQEVVKFRQNLKEAQDRNKIYENQNGVHKEFHVGENVYLYMRTIKNSLKLGSCAKLAHRYCRPIEVLDRIGLIAYRLAFITDTKADNVFHISFLNKYFHDPEHVINWGLIKIEPEGKLQTDPLHILNMKVTLLQNQAIEQVKVQ